LKRHIYLHELTQQIIETKHNIPFYTILRERDAERQHFVELEKVLKRKFQKYQNFIGRTMLHSPNPKCEFSSTSDTRKELDMHMLRCTSAFLINKKDLWAYIRALHLEHNGLLSDKSLLKTWEKCWENFKILT
jgi:hypothetical protein